MPVNSIPALSRSPVMASSTPGYCTFTATARPSWVRARWTWPIDAAAIGIGSHSANSTSGAAPSSSRDHLGGQLGRHRRGVLLELGQRLAHRLGQALVEVAGHLAELHHGALHVAERLGHLLGGLQLAGLVDGLAALGVGEHAAGPVGGPAAAGLGDGAGQQRPSRCARPVAPERARSRAGAVAPPDEHRPADRGRGPRRRGGPGSVTMASDDATGTGPCGPGTLRARARTAPGASSSGRRRCPGSRRPRRAPPRRRPPRGSTSR